MSEQDKGFTVKDRRVFSADEPAAEDKAAGSEPLRAKTEQPADTSAERAQAPLPQINFPTFIASLNASAPVHLGFIKDPVSGQAEKNLPMAKQTIDILNMLQQKTTGNLTADEDSMLKSILYDLRILFVKEKG